jgi:predicted ester cyclase
MGMPATRRHLELAVMHVDRVVNGKLVEHQGIANGSDLMQQLGANRAEL